MSHICEMHLQKGTLGQTISSFKEVFDTCFPKVTFQSAFTPHLHLYIQSAVTLTKFTLEQAAHILSFHSGKYLYTPSSRVCGFPLLGRKPANDCCLAAWKLGTSLATFVPMMRSCPLVYPNRITESECSD